MGAAHQAVWTATLPGQAAIGFWDVLVLVKLDRQIDSSAMFCIFSIGSGIALEPGGPLVGGTCEKCVAPCETCISINVA